MSRSRALAIGVIAILVLGIAVFSFTRADDGFTSGETSGNPITSGATTSGATTSQSTTPEPTSPASTTSATTPAPETTSSPSDAPTSAGTVSPGDPDDTTTAAPPVGEERAADSLCAVAPAEVEQFADFSGSNEATLESLRDAIPLLDARLSELVAAAEGRPELDEPVQLLEEVLQLWRAALAATDEGDDAAALAALRDSRSTLEQVEAAVTEASSAALPCD